VAHGRAVGDGKGKWRRGASTNGAMTDPKRAREKERLYYTVVGAVLLFLETENRRPLFFSLFFLWNKPVLSVYYKMALSLLLSEEKRKKRGRRR